MPKDRQAFIRVMLSSLLINILALALPLAMLQVYDRIIPNQSFGTAGLLLISVLIAMSLEGFMRFGRSAIVSGLGYYEEVKSNLKLMTNLMYQPDTKFEFSNQGYLLQQHNALKLVNSLKFGQAGMVMFDLPFSFLFILLVTYIGGWLVVIPLLSISFMLLLMKSKKTEIYNLSQEIKEVERQWLQSSIVFYFSIATIKNAGVGQIILNTFREYTKKRLENQGQLDEIHQRFSETVQTIAQANAMLIVLIGAFLVLQNKMTMGAMVACSILAGRSITPFSSLLSSLIRFQSSEKVLKEADEILSKEEFIKPFPNYLDKGKETGLNRNIDLLANKVNYVKGAPYALKKYLTKHPFANCVVFDDKPQIFTGTILENITLFDASKEVDAKSLLNEFGLLDTFNRLPQGLQTMLGTQPIGRLSNATEKILSLIRALLSESQIILVPNGITGLNKKDLQKSIELLQNSKKTVLILSNSQIFKHSLHNNIDLHEGGGS